MAGSIIIAKKEKSISTSQKTLSQEVKVLQKYTPAWVVMNAQQTPGYNLELLSRIRLGVKKSEWKELISIIGQTEKDLEHILPTSISSMQKKSIYGKETSERIYELARLYNFGYQVFDTKEDFKNWLMSSSQSLGGKMPFELLDSSFGFQVVTDEISRIQYNVYS